MPDTLTAETAPEADDDGLYEVTVRHAIFRYREKVGDRVALRHARRGVTIRVSVDDLAAGIAAGAFAGPDDTEADEVDHDAERARLLDVLDGTVDEVLEHAEGNPDDIAALAALEVETNPRPRKGVLAGLDALAVASGTDDDEDDDDDDDPATDEDEPDDDGADTDEDE